MLSIRFKCNQMNEEKKKKTNIRAKEKKNEFN